MAEKPRARILNVDDDDAGRYVITKILTRAGYDVLEAATGRDAVRLAGERPDLILLDVNLPDIHGFEVCNRIKADPRTASIPVVHLSATRVGSADRVVGLEGGADGYLVQPIDPQELVATVRAFLRLKDAEEALHVRTQALEAVRVITTEITRELDLTTLLELIIRRAVELLGANSGTVRLWDEEAQLLIPVTWHGLGDWAKGQSRRLGEALSGTVAQRREGLIVNDYPMSPYANPAILEHVQINAMLAEPLLYRDRLLGVLTADKHGPGSSFTEKDQEVLRLFATQAAIAMENARLFAELNQSFHALQQAQGELVRTEKLRALGQMAAGIAHNLNNILMAIVGQVELLKLQGETPDIRTALDTLKTAALDGAQVVRRLQDSTRHQPTGSQTVCDLASLVREAVALTRPHWKDEPEHRGVTIAVRTVLPDLPPILGHPAEIREALTNVLLNAADAMPSGGILTLSARPGSGARDQGPGPTPDPGPPTPEFVELQVTDTGLGMSEEVQRQIFDPFFTTKGGHGTGLGLSRVSAIMERHRGRIDVVSALGEGTTFTLRFPVAPASALPLPAASGGVRPVPGRRILLVEDDPAVRKTLAALLREAGHTVTEADGGTAALALLADHPVDLVLTDLGMPELTGWEVARLVKAHRPQLPVVLLTGWGQQPGVIAEHQGVVDRVLGKPCRLEELLGVILELTGEQPPVPSGEIQEKAEA